MTEQLQISAYSKLPVEYERTVCCFKSSTSPYLQYIFAMKIMASLKWVERIMFFISIVIFPSGRLFV